VTAIACLVVAIITVAALQTREIDAAVHALVYRQTATRMETLDELYRDPPPLGTPIQAPFGPGAAIAIPDPTSGWLLTGLVLDSSQTGFVSVALTDGTKRMVPIADLELLQDARIPPLQLFNWVITSMDSIFVGLPDTGEAPNVGWLGSALLWDVLFVLAALGIKRTRLEMREWIFPLCVTLGTIAALSSIPGAPGNAERHRATQTLPALLVLATGLLVPSVQTTAAAARTTFNKPQPAAGAAAAVARGQASEG
jgi:hypothetical protein